MSGNKSTNASKTVEPRFCNDPPQVHSTVLHHVTQEVLVLLHHDSEHSHEEGGGQGGAGGDSAITALAGAGAVVAGLL